MPIIAAISTQCSAIFFIDSIHLSIKSLFSSISSGGYPHIASSEKTAKSASFNLASLIAEIILLEFPSKSAILKFS